jgi:peptide/nickel transport system substrate-binding protein
VRPDLRTSTRWFIAVCASATMAVALAACGESGEPGQGTPAVGGASQAGGGGPAPKEVTIGVVQKVASLDPDKAIEVAPLNVNHLLYGTLTEYEPDGSGVRPGLAEKWEVSDDGRRITFTIRSGVKFSDGTPLTAADVAASFSRFIADKANVNGGSLAPVKSVEATDDTTVVFRLRSPYPSFITILAQPAFPVLPADRVKRASFYKEPISAGPYKLESWGGGESIVLARNDLYPGPKPVVEKIKFVTIPDPNARVAQLKSGQIDIASDLGPALGQQLSGDTRAVFVEQFSGIYLYVNNRVKPLDDVRVRQAISLAADREQINQVVFAGKSSPLGDLFPTTMKWSKPVLDIEPDIERAKAMLKGTACENGCSLKLMSRNGREAYQRPGIVLKEDLSKIGIELQIEQVDNSVAGAREYEGNYELEVGGLYDYADVPDGFLIYGVQSDGGIFALYSGYKNAEMDAAAKQVMVTDGAERDAALEKVHELFKRDVPYVPLVDYPLVIGTRLPSDDIVSLGPTSFFEVARADG